MLLRLASVSVPNLQRLKEEADVIVIRIHLLYEVANLFQCYALRVLRPRTDFESDNQNIS